MSDSPLGSSPLNPYSGLAKVYEIILKVISSLLPAGPGWAKKNFASHGPHYCPSCGGIELFRYQVRYTYIHILHLFSFLVRRRYAMTCNRCAAPIFIDADDIAELLHKDPVPWIRRRGWALCLGAVGLAVAVGYANNFYERTVNSYRIDSPEVGDLYLMDFFEFSRADYPIPDSHGYPYFHISHVYMRVIKVEADTLAFAPSYSEFSSSGSRVRRAMRDNPGQFEFSVDDAIVIERRRLAGLLDMKAIVEVTRGE